MAWPSLVRVAAAARDAGVAVTVLQAAVADRVLDYDGVRVEFVAEPHDSTIRRRLGTWASRPRRRLLRQLRRLAPDVVHLHGLSFPSHARDVLRAVPGARLLVQDHADRPPPRWRRALHRRGLAEIGGAAFTAQEQAAPFVEAGVLRPGLPVFEIVESSTAFTPGAQRAARARTGIFGDPCLLWLGHLDANKDPLAVLEALSRTASALPNPHLWCCFRSAPLRDDVERRLDDAALRGRVHMLGARPHAEVEHFLRAADFLVQGSHREGSGYAVIEALACGTPPLVTDIPSFRRLTAQGTVGALSPPGDPAAMAQALIAWSQRDRAALRAATRAHFERELSFSAIGRQLRAAYQALLDCA